jgi:hypothetical protein
LHGAYTDLFGIGPGCLISEAEMGKSFKIPVIVDKIVCPEIKI